MNLKSGIKLLEENIGEGPEANKGDTVIYNSKIFLNKGDEIPLNKLQVERIPEQYNHIIRTVDNYKFIDHTTTLGKRESIAGVEHTLIGMKEGGYRKVKVSPHLAYREKGIPDLIPGKAVLTIEIWLREIVSKNKLNCNE